ncbi:MAG: HAD hydrolase-like protein [Clostridia bacterium]|nr:HAD hydrolase-like protein [Clostridia bacterium]
MIKNIIFDLSEVIISGFHKAEYIVEKNTNIKAEEFLEQRKKVNDIFLDAMRGKYTENEYIEALLKSANWNVNKEIIKKSIRQNLDTKVDGTMKIIEKLSEQYNLILLSDHIKEWVEYILSTNKELEIFKHKYFSYEYGKLKTDEGTFNYVLDTEKILPDETIFIDDSKENVEIANQNGICGIVFEDAKQLEKELQEMNII